MNKIKEKGCVYITAIFTEEMEKRARIQAAIEGVSKSELIRKAVEKYLMAVKNE